MGLFGIKDAGLITLYDRATNKPELYLDYANSFEISTSSTPVYAMKQGQKSISWNGAKETTCKFSTQLTSNELFSFIFNSPMVSGARDLYKEEVFNVKGSVTTFELKETPKTNTVVAFKLEADGVTHVNEMPVAVTAKTVTIASAKPGDIIRIYYITNVTGKSFALKGTDNNTKDYKLVAVARGKDSATGKQIPFEIILPKVTPQSNLTVTLDSENPSTIDVTLDCLVDENNDILIWNEMSSSVS